MDWTIYLFGACAAVLVGLGKTGIPGMGILVVPIMAMIFPARASVGVLLPMLICADLFAVAYYRRHAQWRILFSLAPWIVLGLIAGAGALYVTKPGAFGKLLGGLVLVVIVLEYLRRRLDWHAMPDHPLFTSSMGALAGFSTMTGNVAGPVMNLYLVCRGLDKHQFMGSMAWLFLVINCSKVPVFAAFDMITRESLAFNLYMIPAIAAGAILGRWLLPRISTTLFYRIIITFAIAAALKLILAQ